MLEQTFSFSDIPRIGFLTFLEILLSADNAIVLGLISSSLPETLRRKALYLGFVSAIFFRAVGILGISFLLGFHWLPLLAALYLLYLSIRHFIQKGKKTRLAPPRVSNFWKTVLMIELFDLAFAVDSILAGLAFLEPPIRGISIHPKLWIVYFGGLIGVFTIRYAASLFGSLIRRFPRLETVAYLMIGWIGLKLGFSALDWIFPYFTLLFWIGLIFLFPLGFTKRKYV